MNIVQTIKNFQKLVLEQWAIMKNPEMLKFISDHLKTKKMCKHPAKKLPFVLRYISDRYKTQHICDTVILENGGRLEFVPDC